MVLKKEKELAISGKAKGQCSRGDQCSFRHEIHDRAKPTPKAAPSSEPPTPRVEVCREKGASEAEASLGSPTDSLQKVIERCLHKITL